MFRRIQIIVKRLFSAALAALLLLLAGCGPEPSARPEALTDTDLPLSGAARLGTAPEFLTEEQQLLYRQAFVLYSAMFDGETTGIDDAFPGTDAQTEHDEYTPPDSDCTYVSSNSRWRDWADFDRVVHGLFTDAFWSACNDSGSGPIYIERDGRLFILDCAYGDQYYNGNIPDEFTLAAQSDERIDFTVTAHYSYPYPRQDETQEERDNRLETSYEYTRTYPVTLVNTDAGWRFDAFTTPNQADMRLLGEWDGVEETEFYGGNASGSSASLYVNERLGFSMEMPLSWLGQVEVEEEYDLPHRGGGNCVTFYHKATRDNGEGGVLFFLDCYPGQWSEDDPPVVAGHSVVVAQTEEDTYLLRTPSDVEYSQTDPALAAEYQALAAQQDFISTHICITDQKK